MPRLRVAFSKQDPVRFLSHLEIVRVWERALRRAGFSLAYTSGFNPHPKLSFASALAVGVTSDQEYVDIGLQTEVDPAVFQHQLQQQLPEGFTIKRALPVPETAPAMMAVVNRAVYRVTVPVRPDIEPGRLEARLREFLRQQTVTVVKKGKKGPKKVDIRPGIYGLTVTAVPAGDQVVFTMELQAGNRGNVRPEEVIEALATGMEDVLDWKSMFIHRTDLAIAGDGCLNSPLEVF